MVKSTLALLFCLLFLSGGDDRYIHWESGRKLTWEDFTGPSNQEVSSKAYTWTKISMNWDCEEGKFVMNVVAKFDKTKSWKKDVMTPYLLAHEQLHFDITELYARKIRAHFASIPDACSLSADEVKSRFQELLDEWDALEVRYDNETRHSKDKVAQARWDLMISKEIKALAKYAAP